MRNTPVYRNVTTLAIAAASAFWLMSPLATARLGSQQNLPLPTPNSQEPKTGTHVDMAGLLAKYCVMASAMGLERNTSRNPMDGAARAASSGDRCAGWSRNQSSQAAAQATPRTPRIPNAVRHPHRASIHASTSS